MQSALSRLIILTASRCLHGDEVREKLFEDVARLFHDISAGMTPLSVVLPHAPIPAHTRRDKVGAVRSSRLCVGHPEVGRDGVLLSLTLSTTLSWGAICTDSVEVHAIKTYHFTVNLSRKSSAQRRSAKLNVGVTRQWRVAAAPPPCCCYVP